MAILPPQPPSLEGKGETIGTAHVGAVIEVRDVEDGDGQMHCAVGWRAKERGFVQIRLGPIRWVLVRSVLVRWVSIRLG